MARSQWLGASIVAAGIASSLGGPAASEAPPAPEAGQSPAFVKVGDYYFNPARIRHVRDFGKSLRVTFGSVGSTPDVVKLEGPDADTMRRWLDGRSTDLKAESLGLKEHIRIADPLRVPQTPP